VDWPSGYMSDSHMGGTCFESHLGTSWLGCNLTLKLTQCSSTCPHTGTICCWICTLHGYRNDLNTGCANTRCNFHHHDNVEEKPGCGLTDNM
jgi:hypothetical protein